MRDEAKSYLHDMQRAADRLGEFTAGKTFSDYTRDAMLRAAVERQFEIIGEALAKLARLDPDLANRIREHRRIIAFRNILVHGYSAVDDRLVWDIAESKLASLRADIAALLTSP
jgi:uncharacterized protein with HEPN domain